jgi:hypothetical protein
MPSTLVHLALGALLAAALLGDEFDARSLLVVLAVVAFPDLDTFVGMVLPGTHRAILHTLLVPATAAAVVAYDTRIRDRSALRRYGDRGVRVAWVALAAYVLAGIGPDLFFNGVNVFYPITDHFVELNGELYLSSQQGIVQTLWSFDGGSSPMVGTTENVHYRTGVDVARGRDPADAERVFPLAMNGLQALLVLTAAVVTPARLWMGRDG